MLGAISASMGVCGQVAGVREADGIAALEIKL